MQLTAYRSKLFAVDIFNYGGSMDKSPWWRLGEPQSLDQAIATCKKVADKYLSQRKHLAACVLPPKGLPSTAQNGHFYRSSNGSCSI